MDGPKKVEIGKHHYKPPQKKRMSEGRDRVLPMKKATRLASHFATMDFMIERAGNGVIPRELFGQTSHLIRGATCFRESS